MIFDAAIQPSPRRDDELKPSIIGTSTSVPSSSVKDESAVASWGNGSSHDAFMYRAFTSASTVAGSIAPAGMSSGIRSRVASATKSLIWSATASGSGMKSTSLSTGP